MTEAPPTCAQAITDAYLAAIDKLRLHGFIITEHDENSIRNSLISPVRAAMIRGEYNRAREQGIKSEAVQVELAERYGVSYALVHQIVIHRR